MNSQAQALRAYEHASATQTIVPTPTLGGEERQAHGEYLAFCLGDQTYAVDILAVQEIRGVDRVTRLPQSHDYMRGVINLRGTIVPVLDLRARLGLGAVVQSATTVMIVMALSSRTFAMVVDSVSDVVQLNPDDVRPVPPMSALDDAAVLRGVGVVNERMLLLLDADRVLDRIEDVSQLECSSGP